jgi:metallo-beta-lactamase family protein
LTVASHGAARQVSGSLHVLDTGNARWMIDCGAFYAEEGGEEAAREPASAAELPTGATSVAALFLTHAHTDHLGRVPQLIDAGFAGPIYLTAATATLADPMLRAQIRFDEQTRRDWVWSRSARERCERQRKSLWVHWRGCKLREPIAADDAASASTTGEQLRRQFAAESPRLKIALCEACLDDHVAAIARQFRPLKYDEPKTLAAGVRVRLLDAGHVPGSASVMFEVEVGQRTWRVVFSGDLGHGGTSLFAGPQPAPPADAAIIEATYGPLRRAAAVAEQRRVFREAVAAGVRDGGVAWIPAFALDRTQKVLYELRLAQQENLLPESLPIYCPSPTAKEITRLYRAHQNDGWFYRQVAADAAAFAPREVRTTVPAPSRLPRPCILVSTSDITRTEWMRRMLRELLPDRNVAMLLVSYHAADSAAGRLKAGAKELQIDDRPTPVRARVLDFPCFSGHGDAGDVDRWLANLDRTAAVVLVHGSPEQLAARADELRRGGRQRVVVAQPGKPVDLLYPASMPKR